jgi:hypothetical protein
LNFIYSDPPTDDQHEGNFHNTADPLVESVGFQAAWADWHHDFPIYLDLSFTITS